MDGAYIREGPSNGSNWNPIQISWVKKKKRELIDCHNWHI